MTGPNHSPHPRMTAIARNRTLIAVMAVFIAIVVIGAPSVAAGKMSNHIQVPFNLDRNRVIIPTSINGSKPLNLILDTGMRFDGVYLFHKELMK